MTEIELTEKGKSVKDLPEIIIKENDKEIDLTFLPIYELGRHVSEGDLDFSMKPLDEIDCSNALKENVNRFFQIFAEKVLSENLNFPSILIDFVVFDPEDRKGERFHIAICSTSADLIEDYKKQVEINIDGNLSEYEDQPQVRGPILTNSNIYKSPYFFRGPKDRDNPNPAFFHEIKRYSNIERSQQSKRDDRLRISFGSFKAKRENKVSKEIQKAHIEIFFDHIENELYNGKGLIKVDNIEIPEKKFEFNTSLLIPLLRPAASFDGDKDFRLRGGGLFVYGNTPQDANHSEMVSRLQHFFYRNILNESHTQMVYDYLRHEGQNHQIHDFKTFLSSEWIDKVRRVVDRNQLNILDKSELNEVIYNVDLFRRYLNEILEAYRDFINQNAKTVRFRANHLRHLINELNKEFENKINVEFEDEIRDESICIKVTHIVLKKVFRNLYSNAINEYDNKETEIKKRATKVRWLVSDDNEFVIIEFHNKGLQINNELIKDFGIKPIAGYSTGMGGYFINNTLGWMLAEENKFPDEIQTNVKRYIRAENDKAKDLVKFTFKFKLLKR